MTRTTLKGLLLASSILGSAGLAHAEDVTLTIESWRNDDLTIWQEKTDPGFRSQEPGHQGRVRADRADRIQRRAERQARCRLRRRSRHLPSVRRLAGALQQGHLADLTGLPGMENFSPVAKSPGRRTMALPPSACRWLRLSTASSTTRTPSTSSASRCRQRKPSSSQRSRQDQG